MPLFLIVWYWIYLNFVFGYWLSEIFYNFFYSTKLKKKFTFKNIIQVIIDFFWKLIKNWFIRIGKKSLLLKNAIDRLIIAVKIFRKKFKSLLKVKHTFQLLKNLLPIPFHVFWIFSSLWKDIFYLRDFKNWAMTWIKLIQLLMQESLCITGIVYILYLLILGIISIILGFFIGILYQQEETENNKIEFILFLLFLLRIIGKNRIQKFLLEIFYPRFFNPVENIGIDEFSKFPLKSIEQIEPRPLKIMLIQPNQSCQFPFPFPIIEDPLVIETQIFWEEPIAYKFELFQFYQNVSEKVNLFK